MINFDNPTNGATFEVDAETRTIRGLALPFNTTAKSGGRVFQFAKGTVTYGDVSRVKLLVAHDATRAVGYATEIEETDDGLFMAFKVARGAAGDEALSFAEDRVWDGLSVGIGDDAKWSNKEGVFHAVNAPLMETSLTPFPAYSDARLTSVAAQSDDVLNIKEPDMTDQVENQTAESVDMSATIADAIKAGFASIASEGPEFVQPVARFDVTEPAPYRFDGVEGQYDFSKDLIAGLTPGAERDHEAYERVRKFMHDAFAPKFNIDTGDVATLNPRRHRPDLYVDERKYSTPFFDALYKGTLPDIGSFDFPLFQSASGLVNDHVEGIEPTAGDAGWTNQVVTPSAVSGKVVINREVWDQGGSPLVSGLIWNKMQYAYFQMMEAKVVARISAVSASASGTNRKVLTAGATNATLVNELEAYLAELQFIAGGNFFSFAGTHIDLYKALAAAVDSNGRKLLPILGATNANGQATSGFKSLDVAGSTFTPVWSLGATSGNASSSYLLDRDAASVWATPPTKLTMDEIKVATVELGIWGYVATAVTDVTGLRELRYDPTA